MKRFYITILIALAALSLTACHEHEDHGHSHGHEHHHGGADGANRPQELKLTPRFSKLLRQEMVQIESGMGRLLSALARGESAKAVTEAEKIKASFILEQALSKAEMQELGKLLPADFIKLDGEFHKSAGRLAAAAGKKDFKKAMEEYGRMSNSCTACHSSFAQQRFPGFAK